VKVYHAYVYARKHIRPGVVRLYLRFPSGRRCGYQEVTPAESKAIPAGEVLPWRKVDHSWKRTSRHGTRYLYQKGCRCSRCKRAAKLYGQRQYSSLVALPELTP
jgi:hypothetical protein